MNIALRLVIVYVLLVTSACGSAAGSTPSGRLGPGVVPMADEATFQALQRRAQAAGALDADGAVSSYPTKFRDGLSYDPLTSQYLDKIQGSALALNDADRSVLAANGFVISKQREFPTFVRGLAEIYSEHLPVYVSADAMLEAIHSSYDEILETVEQATLVNDLHGLLTGMRSRLPAASAAPTTLADADLYLAVALGLLDGMPPAPVAGADAGQIASLIQQAKSARGTASLNLFGVAREEDLSQFTPRGHYVNAPGYFQAMVWLGRIDLRLIETQPDGTQVFHRDQYLASLLLADLIAGDADRFQRIEDTLHAFVGKSDNMVVSEVASLVADLGGAAAARAASDDVVARAIAAGGYGQQQIASALMVNDGTVARLPLNRSFLLFGQRYVVDSHVFSEASYDRIADRFMVDPLDAAFAALGNDQALVLDPDVAKVKALPGALSRMRVLIDSHDDAFWNDSLYNLWLKSLRTLSPAPDTSDPTSKGLPEVTGTEAWGRRVLNAQLGSWAELRHDTVLYAKQAYGGIPGCDFPDAYVDPYPEFYAAVVRYADAGARIADIVTASDSTLGSRIAAYFQALRTAATTLGEMATFQQQGKSFSADQLAFINDAVRIDKVSAVCTTIDFPNGWYAQLFFNPTESIEFAPTIADVYTQPADASGTIVGRVLHAATGYPRLIVATVDTCGGPRAYAGVVFAYHETITQNFERLTDKAWAGQFSTSSARPADVPWMASVLSP